MSIWGKVIGGVAGFALGGPLGALMGVGAGHAMDRMRETMPNDGTVTGGGSQDKQMAFTMAVIVLGAKLAKVDGRVTSDEVAAFRKVFSIPQAEASEVGRLFNEAKQDSQGLQLSPPQSIPVSS